MGEGASRGRGMEVKAADDDHRQEDEEEDVCSSWSVLWMVEEGVG